jgi:hypothetical protein
MTVPVDRPPSAAEEPPQAAEAQDPPAERTTPPAPSIREKLGIEERSWVLFAVVVAFILLAFTGMIVLTALGGGSGYVPWGD